MEDISKRKAHPRFIERWAKVYINRLQKDGNEAAKLWAIGFFHRDDIPAIAEKTKEMLFKMGYKA